MRRAGTALALGLAAMIVVVLVWRWPTRGVGGFSVDIAARQGQVAASLDRVMPPAPGVVDAKREPQDLEEARHAYRLHRLPPLQLLCIDACPSWRYGDRVFVAREQQVADPPDDCDGWLRRLGQLGMTFAPLPLEPDAAAKVCAFRGTQGEVVFDAEVFVAGGGATTLRMTAGIESTNQGGTRGRPG